MNRFLIGLFVLLSSESVQAAPLVQLALEGRKQGSGDTFSSTVAVSVGDQVEYRLRVRLAEPGTCNEHLLSDRRNYDPLDDRAGINSLSISIVQDRNDAIRVDMSSPADLVPAWNRATGAGGGQLFPRPGSSWNDLLNIRPIQSPGVFAAIREETVFTGLFTVAAISGQSGHVTGQWGPWAGGGRFDHSYFFITHPTPEAPSSTENSSDPLAYFVPLTLVSTGISAIPEPTSIALAAFGFVGLALVRRTRLTQ